MTVSDNGLWLTVVRRQTYGLQMTATSLWWQQSARACQCLQLTVRSCVTLAQRELGGVAGAC